MQLSDEQLYDQMKMGGTKCEEAFKAIYHRFSKRIYFYIRKMVGSNPVSDELFQDTFLKLLDCAKENKQIENVSAYIYRIARNLTYSEIRNTNKSIEEFLDIADLQNEMFLSYNLNHENSEIIEIIDKALELLPEEHKEAFCLQNYLGLKYGEIATLLNIPITTVRNRVVRSKTRLREILAPYFQEYNK